MTRPPRHGPGESRGQSSANGPATMLETVQDLGRHIGLPSRYLESPQIMGSLILPGLTSIYSDGELELRPAQRIEGEELRQWFGEKRFADSRLAQEVRRLQSKPGPGRKLSDIVEAAAGHNVGKYTALGAQGLPSQLPYDVSSLIIPTIYMPNRDEIAFYGPQYSHNLPTGRPQRVLHYGPSIQGRFWADSQADRLGNEGTTFTYHVAAKGPFTPEYLKSYTRTMLDNPEVAEAYMDTYQDYDSDGMAAASQRLVDGGTDPFDLVVASNLYAAERPELVAGLGNAFLLLSEGGSLALTCPEAPLNVGHVGADEMFAMADSAGFDVPAAPTHEIIIGGHPIVASLLTKQ